MLSGGKPRLFLSVLDFEKPAVIDLVISGFCKICS